MLSVDVWSDIACPWCYVGKRRMESALARFSHPVDLHWRSFELDPEAPRLVDASVTYAERLAKKYRTEVDRAEEMIERMRLAALDDGIEMRFDRIQPSNTFDAHRLLHFAADAGRQDALKERLLLAYFSEGALMSDRRRLVELAEEVGLDGAEASEVLETDRHADDVRLDEAAAAKLGIRGVPFFVVGKRFGLSGAQPDEVLLGVLERAWREEEEASIDSGAVCGPEGC